MRACQGLAVAACGRGTDLAGRRTLVHTWEAFRAFDKGCYLCVKAAPEGK